MNERDAAARQLRGTVPDLRPVMGRIRSDADADRIAALQTEANAAYSAHGRKAPMPISGERPADYAIRLARPLARYHPDWSDQNLRDVPTSVMPIATQQIFEAAARAGSDPAFTPRGTIKQILKDDGSGREIATYTGWRKANGETGTMFSLMGGNSRRVVGWMGNHKAGNHRLQGIKDLPLPPTTDFSRPIRD